MKATVDVVDAQGKSLRQENMTMFDAKSTSQRRTRCEHHAGVSASITEPR
jgi:hypothetical protein